MKKILWIFSSAILLSTAILSTGCGEEDPVEKTPPSIDITGQDVDAVVEDAGTYVNFTVTVEKGSSPLNAITVYEGETGTDKVPVADLLVDGSEPASNAWTVSNKDLDTYEVGIKVTAAAGDAHYRVVVTDEDQQTAEEEVHVEVEAKIEATIEGATINLYNQGGPVGRGGIDLDTGESTGTSLHSSGEDSYLQAELRDMGLDLTQVSDPSKNWHQRIGGINGTVVKQVEGGLTNSEFGNVASKKAIETLFDSGIDFTATVPNYDFNVSEVVQAGDAFVVYKSSTETYYLVVVNSVVVTPGLMDNEDHYNVSIKY